MGSITNIGDDSDLQNILNQELLVKADVTKLAAGTVTLGAGLDVNIAASVVIAA